jgi:uncharacterized protein YjiS (DUF1127 family)
MHQTRNETGEHGARPDDPWARRAFRFVRGSVNRVADTLALWHFRSTSRQEIEMLDERLLKDAGLDRSEAYKPFWRK